MEYAKENNIEAGCVKHAHIRLAKTISFLDVDSDYEIVSITGTISKDGLHLHISSFDTEGNTVGGHLSNGTIINTTCELVILELSNYSFTREFDEKTGYKELVITEK